MTLFDKIINFEPTIEPNLEAVVKYFKMKKTVVKIYIPKKIVNGKRVPDINLVHRHKTRWYVYYYFKNPVTSENIKYKYYLDINKEDTYKRRLEMATLVKTAIELRLMQGYVPNDIETSLLTAIHATVEMAIKFAISEKLKIWSESTRRNNLAAINVFTDWLKNNNLLYTNIKNLKKRHISLFLSYLISDRNNNNISRNNYRRILSSLFKELVVNEYIDTNFIEHIPKLDEKPAKNKAFTVAELVKIKDWLIINDPYLHKYLQFVTYAFFRPVEVCRIKIKDIDLASNRIFVRTKTETTSIIRIIDNLQLVLSTFEIEKYKPTNYLFSNLQTPSDWKLSSEKSRSAFFIRRFKKVKDHFNFSDDYGIYSFRHTFALDLYTTFINDGLTDLEAKQKLMTITRHKSLSGLNNYLRNIGAFVPKDYSNDYSIKF